jgi:hypothetical protein
VIGQAAEIIPAKIQSGAALLLIVLTLIKVLPVFITHLGKLLKSSERKNRTEMEEVSPDVTIPECTQPT